MITHIIKVWQDNCYLSQPEFTVSIEDLPTIAITNNSMLQLLDKIKGMQETLLKLPHATFNKKYGFTIVLLQIKGNKAIPISEYACLKHNNFKAFKN